MRRKYNKEKIVGDLNIFDKNTKDKYIPTKLILKRISIEEMESINKLEKHTVTKDGSSLNNY